MFTLYNNDCIEQLNNLIEDNVKVDLILTDPPYGTVKGMKLDGWKDNSTSWDDTLPINEVYTLSEKILRQNGTLILFSQEPFTSQLRTQTITNLPFIYPLIWKKDHFANPLSSKKAPVNYFEDINVFRKIYDTSLQNPLRKYSQKILEYINLSKKDIGKIVEYNKIDHFFRYKSSQFVLCAEETYNELIKKFHIDQSPDFIPYKELIRINNTFNNTTFNLPKKSKFKSNILEHKKDYTHFHPTQNPVALLEDLIKTYSNPGDTIIDFTMGSGSTGVAAYNTNRNFIGIELDEKYYNIAVERLEEAKAQPKLY